MPWRVYLGPALFVTWLAGMGGYWDHPPASGLQMLGIGSIVYVFALALVLLRPRGAGGRGNSLANFPCFTYALTANVGAAWDSLK